MNKSPIKALALLCALGLFTPSLCNSAPPAWWASRGATNGAAADDFAIVNQGQLKWMTAKAAEELAANLPPIGAGATLQSMVAAWTTTTTNADDYSVVNLGQLKNLATPFWDRLIAEHRVLAYPWTGAIAAPDDYASANLGQLKALFNFDPANPDQDGDGISDVSEVLKTGTNPLLADTNGNNIADGLEDPDGDGINNLDELALGLNPLVSETAALRTTYTYDLVGRLVGAVGAPATLAYTSDVEGNITTAQ